MKLVLTFFIGLIVGIILTQLYTSYKVKEKFAIVNGIACSIDSRNPACESHFRSQGMERGPDGNWRVPPIGGGWENNNGVGWGGPMF